VLAECFGVAFPDEFFELAEYLPLVGHKSVYVDYHAGRLVVPPERDGPVAPRPGPSGVRDDDYPDEKVLECDPDLVPLVRLDDLHTEYGGLTLCYRLTELAGGRPTIFGVDTLDPVEGVEPCGTSLVAVLREYHAAVVARLETLARHAPELAAPQRLADHRAALRRVDALRRPADAPTTQPRKAATLPTLRARASRGDYRSMGNLARALYATGLGPREVLAECFGVAFPEEFFVIADVGVADNLPGDGTTLPWELAVPLERGGPMVRPRGMWRAERRIFAADPDLVPLVALYSDWRVRGGAERSPHGGLIHCYRLTELAAGRGTVVGVPWNEGEEDLADGDWHVTSSGDSLFTVLHEYLVSLHRMDESEFTHPGNRGAGSIDLADVEASREAVAEFEALRRRLDERTGRAE